MSVMGDFLRKQATRCIGWSRDCFDLETARRLRLMAEEFRTKASEIDATSDEDESEFDYSHPKADGSSLQA